MFDIGMTELLLIGIVALIVVGPKDLPGMFQTLGRFTAKARSLGREFTRAMNEAANETGVKDVAEDLRKATSPKSMGLDALKGAADKFEKWEPTTPAAERGGETAKLAEDRAEAAEKIREATAAKARERLAREAAEAEAAKPGTDTPAKKPAAKPAAKAKTTKPKSAAAKAAPKAAPAKKPAAAKKPAPARKPAAAKKPAAGKTASKPKSSKASDA